MEGHEFPPSQLTPRHSNFFTGTYNKTNCALQGQCFDCL